MTSVRIVDRPTFTIAGQKTWISGQDNSLFGRFWEQCRENGLLRDLSDIQQKNGLIVGAQTGGTILGVSRVEKDPARRAFDYMIAIEIPDGLQDERLETYQVPAARWAVFGYRGGMPEALVEAEIFAFTQWLPSSGYQHAHAPEMEVYLPEGSEFDGEFWLPIEERHKP